jgi:ppGpp synthetase/RelA/SpoT-type nucleotidyltranferase
MGNPSTCFEKVEVAEATKERNFRKIAEDDLETAFALLRSRCPKTWKPEHEVRARAFHKNFMILKNSKSVEFIDPAPKYVKTAQKFRETKVNAEITVKKLMTEPNVWNMEDKENAKEFFEILLHLTKFTPFEGRPFVRAWLEALLPCLCRWVLSSVKTNLNKDKAVGAKNSSNNLTLKHFIGVFGQPGIICCLADRGEKFLKTLQCAARAGEAMGRGEVERYYWKRITESLCDGTNDWGNLAGLEDNPLELSQLDNLPLGWLEDADDQGHVFAEVVSKEITPIFEKYLKDTLSTKANAKVKAGPAKTLSRTSAKCDEYREEFPLKQTDKRWSHFAEKFQEAFGRPPSKPVDFVWNIVDFARCSVEVRTASDVFEVKKLVEDRFKVVAVKNGYNSNVHVKGSGYRDIKILVEVEYNNLKFEKIPAMNEKTVFICEIQIVCAAWLENKKSTSLPYKILRAKNLRALFKDFKKYIFKDQTKREYDALDVIKNG